MKREQIKQVFLENGFTVKPGETDLKPYVYEAAEALLKLAAPEHYEIDHKALLSSIESNGIQVEPDVVFSILKLIETCTVVNTEIVPVNAEQLEMVLRALNGPPHHIRELQALMKPPFDNPIVNLTNAYNTWLEQTHG